MSGAGLSGDSTELVGAAEVALAIRWDSRIFRCPADPVSPGIAERRRVARDVRADAVWAGDPHDPLTAPRPTGIAATLVRASDRDAMGELPERIEPELEELVSLNRAEWAASRESISDLQQWRARALAR